MMNFQACWLHCAFLPLQRTSLGRELLERVFYHLNLEEREYFGLKYLDVNSVCQWLDPLKEVKKQSKDKGSRYKQYERTCELRAHHLLFC